MRITTSMIARQYEKNTNRSMSDLNKAFNKMSTFRAFNAPSDDPFAAAQTFQIDREYNSNEYYQSNLSNVQDAFKQADTTLVDTYDLIKDADSTSGTLKGINGGMNQENRQAIATSLRQARDSILAQMNSQFGGQYLFGGAGDPGTPPFTVDGAGNLLYRGINVDTGKNSNGGSATIDYTLPDSTKKTMQINFGKSIGDKLDGYSVNIATNTTAAVGHENITSSVDAGSKTITLTINNSASKSQTKQKLQDFLQTNSTFQTQLNTALGVSADAGEITISGLPKNNSDASDTSDVLLNGGTATGDPISSYVNLDDLANEKVFTDIGLGLKTDASGNVLDQSAFNSSLPGLQFLGYGTDPKTGVPKNIYSLMTQMANKLYNYSSNDNQALIDDLDPYMNSFTDAEENFSTKQGDVGAKETNFLTPTSDYLTNADLNLKSKDQNVEYVDPPTAITDYYMQLMSYNAALKAGNEVLQPTLMDFMK